MSCNTVHWSSFTIQFTKKRYVKRFLLMFLLYIFEIRMLLTKSQYKCLYAIYTRLQLSTATKHTFTRQRHKHAFTNSANMHVSDHIFVPNRRIEFFRVQKRTRADYWRLRRSPHLCSCEPTELKVELFVTFILQHLFHLPKKDIWNLLFSNLNSGLEENKFERTTKKWHYYNMTATSRTSRNTETTFAHWLISEKEDDFIKLNVSRCHSDCH